MEISIKTNRRFSLRLTILSHGWVDLSPWAWDDEASILTRPERLNHKIAAISISQAKPDRIRIEVKGVRKSKSIMAGAESVVGRWLSLEWDPDPAIKAAKRNDTTIARFIESGGGRFLRGSTFYEDFVMTLCTVNASWGFTRSMVSRLVDEIGGGVFPRPVEVLEAGHDHLLKKIRMGYRAKVLIEATEALISKGLISEEGTGKDDDICYEDLISLKGIGPYAANHLMLLLHDFSRIPVDSSVTRYCTEMLGLTKADIPAHFASWGDFSFLGFQLGRIISRTNWTG